jgi:hypothetical protein
MALVSKVVCATGILEVEVDNGDITVTTVFRLNIAVNFIVVNRTRLNHMNTNHTGEETIEAAVVTTVVTISLSLVQVINGMACRNQVKANHVEVDCRGKMGWNSLSHIGRPSGVFRRGFSR